MLDKCIPSWHPVLGVFLLAGLAATGLHAQQVYRIVGPDGRITFSDQPPAPASNAKVSAVSTGSSAGTANLASLPFELQQIANKYPVVLYTTVKCPGCDAGRSYLVNRGIPFAEKTVTTGEDIEAMTKIGGDSTMPYLTIGNKGIKGFAEGEWAQYLTSAAYPETSGLPPGYKYSAAAALAEPKPATPAARRQTARESDATPTATQPAVTPSNPAGIKF